MSAPENLRTGERRTATVLFADMKDFTALSERMDPEEMDGLMSLVFGAFESIIHHYGGTVEKYIGDALVAVFGVPELHEDDPARAINAALEFLERVGRLNQQRPDREAIAFRIGINSGLVTTGRRGEHDVVTGHAMAIASRLQTAANPNAVLVSSGTYERCKSDFAFSEAMPVHARGKDGSMLAYEVRGLNPQPNDDDSIFIGRKHELDTILRSFLRHDPAKAAGYVLAGEAGIGKTRVAHEFVRKLRQLPEFGRGVLYARARQFGTRPFAVIIDLLKSYFAIDEDQPIDQIADTVEQTLGVEHRTALSFASLVAGGTGEQDNQAFVVLYLVLKSIVKSRLSAPYSTLLCVDDLHVIDKSSHDFFQFYLRNADTFPFFLLLNRTVPESIREVFGELEVLELPSLDREDTLQLVQAIASDSLEMDIVRAIMDNAQGNPLFIREYVRYAKENRDAQSLPSTIQNIFLTSLESYEPVLRDLLKKLSVFALNFSLSDARHVHETTDGDPDIVEPAIEVFLRNGVLLRDGEQYAFRYDLFKTALYSSLLNYNKKILHRIVADLMEEAGDPHPLRLLLHLLRAEEYDRASDAIEHCENCTSNLEYLSYLDPLIEALRQESPDRFMRLMFLKSALLFNNGITEEADSLLKEMIELAVRMRSPLYAGRAYHLLTGHNMKAYSFDKARFCGTKAVTNYTRAAKGTFSVQNVLEIMSTSELLRNNSDEVDRITEKIRALEHQEEQSFSGSRLTGSLAEHHLMRGEYRAALELLRAAMPGAQERSDTWYGFHLLLGLAHFSLCDWETLTKTEQVVLEGPSRNLATISQINARLATAHHFLGEESEASRRLQQAEFHASQVRNDFDRIDAYRTLSSCALMQNDVERARRFAEAGLTTGLLLTATYPVFTILMTIVSAGFTEDDREAAEFFLQEADLLLKSSVLLAKRDLMLYHYHRSRTAATDGQRADHRRRAAEHLRDELAALGEARFAAGFLSVPLFGRIEGELRGAGLDTGTIGC